MECEFRGSFNADLSALDRKIQQAVWKKINQIKGNPSRFDFLHTASRIQKARVGGWRIIFRVEEKTIIFFRVGKREVIYKQLGEL